MDNEVWLPVVGYDGKYLVSESGKVKSVFTKSKNGKVRRLGTILKTTISCRGYETVKLCGVLSAGGRKSKTVKVHRLVCSAFHPNPESKPQVNHKDLNPLNNYYKNLEWATAKENTNHAQANGRMPTKKPFIPAPTYYKPVVDLKTGKISNTELAAKEVGMTRRELARRLNGERHNETTYRYVGKEDVPVTAKRVRLPRKKPIGVFDLSGNLLKVFDFVHEASVFTKVGRGDMARFIRGKCGPCKGFRFKYISEDGHFIEPPAFIPMKRDKMVIIRGPKTPAKKIIQYEKGTMDVIKQYDSIGAVALSFGASRSTFKKQLNSTGNYKGFVFKYA